MFPTLFLLLVLVASSTVTSIDREAANWLTQTFCLLSRGSKDSILKVLDTKCQTNCDVNKKRIKFVCQNYKEGKVCDAAMSKLGRIASLLSCKLKCRADHNKATIEIKCRK
ncbi:hypothetical protein Bhyg_11288 [Pseudolycoriella hygida]|uniref:Uncharacterized protein n=1 Tax=Pseudolycoriella hygida TaxID=35572 RepID=A0A9Q0RZS9_9DIPT|nr:hypothetical protein Bhyg_11288 [Pseudolycoriella hygida]